MIAKMFNLALPKIWLTLNFLGTKKRRYNCSKMVMKRHIGLIFRDPRGGCSGIDTVECSDDNVLQ